MPLSTSTSIGMREAFDLRSVHHGFHPVDHRLLEPSLNLLGLLLGALDDNLIVDGEDGDRSGTLAPPLVEESKGEL